MDHVILKICIMTAIAFLSIALSVWIYYYFVKVKRAPWHGWRSYLSYGSTVIGGTLISPTAVRLLEISEIGLWDSVVYILVFSALWITSETIAVKLFGKPSPRKQSDYSPAKQ